MDAQQHREQWSQRAEHFETLARLHPSESIVLWAVELGKGDHEFPPLKHRHQPGWAEFQYPIWVPAVGNMGSCLLGRGTTAGFATFKDAASVAYRHLCAGPLTGLIRGFVESSSKGNRREDWAHWVAIVYSIALHDAIPSLRVKRLNWYGGFHFHWKPDQRPLEDPELLKELEFWREHLDLPWPDKWNRFYCEISPSIIFASAEVMRWLAAGVPEVEAPLKVCDEFSIVKLHGQEYRFDGTARKIVAELFRTAEKNQTGISLARLRSRVGSDASSFRVESYFREFKTHKMHPGYSLLVEKCSDGHVRLPEPIAELWRAQKHGARTTST